MGRQPIHGQTKLLVQNSADVVYNIHQEFPVELHYDFLQDGIPQQAPSFQNQTLADRLL